MTSLPAVWDLEAPWTSELPLSLNYRLDRWTEADRVKQVRTWAMVAAKAAAIPALDHCVVELIWTVKDRRDRDSENPVPTLKAACDGIVDAGVVPKDTPEFMTKLMPSIEYVKGVSRVVLRVTG